MLYKIRFAKFSIALSLVLLVAVFTAHGTKDAKVRASDFARIDQARLLPGDLVFVRGNTWRGWTVMMAEKKMPYSHVGILSREGHSLVVVDASPDSKGRNDLVRKRPLEEFLGDPKIKELAIYRLTESGLDSKGLSQLAGEAAYEIYRQKVPFDHAFDLSTEDSVYCTELVWLAFLQAGIDLCEGSFINLDSAFFKHPVILPSSLVSNFNFTRIL